MSIRLLRVKPAVFIYGYLSTFDSYWVLSSYSVWTFSIEVKLLFFSVICIPIRSLFQWSLEDPHENSWHPKAVSMYGVQPRLQYGGGADFPHAGPQAGPRGPRARPPARAAVPALRRRLPEDWSTPGILWDNRHITTLPTWFLVHARDQGKSNRKIKRCKDYIDDIVKYKAIGESSELSYIMAF